MTNQDAFYEGILKLETVEECRRFFSDICTIKELESISQRFQVACELARGGNYIAVYEKTGVSTATICRVNKCLNHGDGGYRLVLDRLGIGEEKP